MTTGLMEGVVFSAERWAMNGSGAARHWRNVVIHGDKE